MKNKFYLFILIGSLVVCGTVVFRPRVADRVFGLLGLRTETASPYVAPELDGLSSAETGDMPTFDDDADGFAVAGPLQAMSPQFADDLQSHPAFGGADSCEPSFEGFAMSGPPHENRVPDFSPEFGFAGYDSSAQIPSTSFAETRPAPGAIEIDFGQNATADPASQPSPTGTMTPEIQFGFAATHPVQTMNADAGFAVSGNSNPIQPVAHADFGVPSAISNASFIIPDQEKDGGFADYRPPTASRSDMPDDRFPHEQDGFASSNVLPVTYIQPVTDVPQLSPQETPLYVPPGNTGQTPGAWTGPSVPQSPPQSVPDMAVPTMPPMPVPSATDYGQTHQNAIASVDRRNAMPGTQPSLSAVPVLDSERIAVPFDDRRSQYEPEVIAEIETVFASEMLAKIGSKNVIMTCDILSEVRETIHNYWAQEYRKAFEEYGQQATVDDERNFKAEGMQITFEQTLNSWIELQMLYLDLTMNVPEEAIEQIQKEEIKNFDATILPQMMEQYGVTNRYDLDGELRKFGTTLERKRENLILKRLAGGWFAQKIKLQKSDLTSGDMIAYYERHKEEKYKKTGHAKWEELVILFSDTPNEQEAYAKIAALGNRVLQGEPLADVARNGSQGLTSHRGGERETEVDKLTTKTLEKAVFSLPVGQMSQIVREDSGPFAGFYIVRVLDRQETHYVPFDNVQNEIQKSIYEEREAKEQERVLAEVRKKYPVEKVPNLQQVIAMAVEAERTRPIVDSPSRHAQLLARAESVAPSKKGLKERPDRENAALAQQNATHPPRVDGQHPTSPPDGVTRIAAATGHATSVPSTWEADPGMMSNESPEAPKKKSLWQSLNPFR